MDWLALGVVPARFSRGSLVVSPTSERLSGVISMKPVEPTPALDDP